MKNLKLLIIFGCSFTTTVTFSSKKADSTEIYFQLAKKYFYQDTAKVTHYANKILSAEQEGEKILLA